MMLSPMHVKRLYPFLCSLLLLITGCTATAQEQTNPKNQSEELGKVHWYRDYTTALQLAEKQNKAVLILFQEVPGCATCRNYGHNVLTHPLMVDAIENEFIALAIYNNKGGADAKVLQRYGEPSWNNPVVRIVDAKGADLVKRVSGNYSALGLQQAMTMALKKQGKTIPAYMNLLGQDLTAIQGRNIEEQHYKMYCFWSGSKRLAESEGVLATESGFMNGYEVVKVTYDANVVDQSTLTKHAEQNQCTPISSHTSYRRSAKDDYYYLQHSDYKYIPLTNLQKTKINAALGSRNTVMAQQYLSPSQKKWLAAKATQKSFLEVSFVDGWRAKKGW